MMWETPTAKEIRMYFMGWKQLKRVWKVALYKKIGSIFRYKITII